MPTAIALSPTPTKRCSLQPDEFRQGKPVNPRGLVQLNKLPVSAHGLVWRDFYQGVQVVAKFARGFDRTPSAHLIFPRKAISTRTADISATSRRAQADFPSFRKTHGRGHCAAWRACLIENGPEHRATNPALAKAVSPHGLALGERISKIAAHNLGQHG